MKWSGIASIYFKKLMGKRMMLAHHQVYPGSKSEERIDNTVDGWRFKQIGIEKEGRRNGEKRIERETETNKRSTIDVPKHMLRGSLAMVYQKLQEMEETINFQIKHSTEKFKQIEKQCKETEKTVTTNCEETKERIKLQHQETLIRLESLEKKTI